MRNKYDPLAHDLYQTQSEQYDESSSDNGEDHVTITIHPVGKNSYCVKFKQCCSKDKVIRTFTWVGYTTDTAYAVFVSLIIAALAAQRNKDNIGWAVTDAGASFIFNAPMAFIFGLNFADFFKKFFNSNATYRVCGFFGFLLGALNAFAGLKLGEDAIFGSQFAFVRGVGYAGVLAYAFNALSTRTVGGTNLLYDISTVVQHVIYKEYTRYSGLFSFLEDLKMYGPMLNASDFSYQKTSPDDNKPFTTMDEISRDFYQALADKGVKPIHPTGQAALKAYKVALGGVLAWACYSLMPMWLFVSEKGLNAATEIFGSTYKLGTNQPWLTWLAAIASELFYMRYAALIGEITIEGVSLPLRKFLKNDSFQSEVTHWTAFTATSLLLLGSGTCLAYWSGGGMAAEALQAANAIANGTAIVAKDTFTDTWLNYITIESGIDYVTGFITGNAVNFGSVTIGLVASWFRSGSWIGLRPNETGGVNDLIKYVEGVVKNRKFDIPSHSSETAARDIRQNRRDIFKASEFKWANLFKCKYCKPSDDILNEATPLTIINR